MPILKPTVETEEFADLFDEDSETVQPKIGTTVQSGWGAIEALTTNSSTEFPADFKFSDEPQLIKFLESAPFVTYEQHWIDGAPKKKSFVCLGDNCPLCDILGDKPRGKFAFNVLVLSGEHANSVQVLTASPALGRQLKKAHEDDRKGPLSREFWEISRMGTGPTTQYTLNYVRGRDLAEEWKLDLTDVLTSVKNAVPFTASQVVRESPRSELLEVARLIA